MSLFPLGTSLFGPWFGKKIRKSAHSEFLLMWGLDWWFGCPFIMVVLLGFLLEKFFPEVVLLPLG